jgi:hypothetical protein
MTVMTILGAVFCAINFLGHYENDSLAILGMAIMICDFLNGIINVMKSLKEQDD